MGPRSEDRGNCSRQRASQRRLRLQWGRDLKIAEIAAIKRNLGAVHQASMGPRSEDRGNLLARLVCVAR